MRGVLVFLRLERKSIVGWSIGVGGYVFLIGTFFAAIGENVDFSAVYEEYPEDLQKAFGGFEDLSTVRGFVRAQLGAYLPLVMSIYAVFVGTKRLAGAEESGELDHTLARPMTRSAYYWTVFAAGALVLCAILLAGYAGGALGFALAGASLRDILGVGGFMLEMVPVAVAYLGVGAMLGALLHRRGAANGIGIAVVMGLFIAEIASRLVEALDWLTYVTPNGYIERTDLFSGDPDPWYWLFCAGLASLTAFIGESAFERKNLYA